MEPPTFVEDDYLELRYEINDIMAPSPSVTKCETCQYELKVSSEEPSEEFIQGALDAGEENLELDIVRVDLHKSLLRRFVPPQNVRYLEESPTNEHSYIVLMYSPAIFFVTSESACIKHQSDPGYWDYKCFLCQANARTFMPGSAPQGTHLHCYLSSLGSDTLQVNPHGKARKTCQRQPYFEVIPHRTVSRIDLMSYFFFDPLTFRQVSKIDPRRLAYYGLSRITLSKRFKPLDFLQDTIPQSYMISYPLGIVNPEWFPKFRQLLDTKQPIINRQVADVMSGRAPATDDEVNAVADALQLRPAEVRGRLRTLVPPGSHRTRRVQDALFAIRLRSEAIQEGLFPSDIVASDVEEYRNRKHFLDLQGINAMWIDLLKSNQVPVDEFQQTGVRLPRQLLYMPNFLNARRALQAHIHLDFPKESTYTTYYGDYPLFKRATSTFLALASWNGPVNMYKAYSNVRLRNHYTRCERQASMYRASLVSTCTLRGASLQRSLIFALYHDGRAASHLTAVAYTPEDTKTELQNVTHGTDVIGVPEAGEQFPLDPQHSTESPGTHTYLSMWLLDTTSAT